MVIFLSSCFNQDFMKKTGKQRNTRIDKIIYFLVQKLYNFSISIFFSGVSTKRTSFNCSLLQIVCLVSLMTIDGFDIILDDKPLLQCLSTHEGNLLQSWCQKLAHPNLMFLLQEATKILCRKLENKVSNSYYFYFK